MNTYFIRHLTVIGAVIACSPLAMAYTGSECTMAHDLADTGIIYKESDCRDYSLDRTIYRQEVAALALRVAERCDRIDDIPEINDYDCDDIFYDVTSSRPNTWACRSVEILADNNIITTSRRDTLGRAFFQPMKDITKSEALSMIMDSAGFEFRGERYDDWRFTGTGAVSWQKPVMQYAEDNDIIPSISSFKPNTIAYRREVFAYAQRSIEHCENGDDDSDNNSSGDNFYITTDDASPDINNFVDLTIRARDGSSTDTSYKGTVNFDVYYRTSSSSSWVKTTSSSYYEIDNDYDNGYTFSSSNDGQKTLNNFIRFKKDDYSYKVVVTDEDNDDTEGYKIFTVGDTGSSSGDTDNFYITTDDASPGINNFVDLTIRARDGSSTDTSYEGDVEFEVYYRASSSSSWIKTTSSSYYEIDNDYDDGYSFTTANRGQKTLANFIRFKKDDYEYKVVVADEDDEDIEGYKIFTVGDSDNDDNNKDTDNFYISTDDASPDTNDGVDLTIRARDGSSTDTSYEGDVEFEIYYRRSESSSWVKTTSSSYYEIDEKYEDGYSFTSSNNGQKTLNNFIQFKKDDYEYKVVVTDKDDADIEGYKTFIVGDYNDDSNECGLGEYESGNNCYSCNGRPSNAYYEEEGTCDWTCNSGYVERNGKCESDSQACGIGQYLSGNSCYSCTTKPSSASYSNYGTCDWSCNSGYYRDGNTCVSNTQNCSIGQYSNGSTCQSCVSGPSNSYYTSAGSCSWACNANYYSSGSQCVPYTQNCGVGQYTSGNICVNCSGKPSNSIYAQTGTCDWTCDYGYTRDGSSCVQTQNYSWYTGSWNTCNATCGGGTKTRIVECRSNIGYVVNNWQCTGTMPTTSQSCNTQACDTTTFDWKIGNWGTCQNNVQDRTVLCERNDGVIVANSNCNSGTKPATSESCISTTYSWVSGSWGTCSNSAQTRTVVCKNSNNATVGDTYCSGSKPTTTQSCTSYSWYRGDANTCGNTCNTTREVVCKNSSGQVVTDSYCTSSKPSHVCSRTLAWVDADSTKSCNTVCNQNNSCWVEDSQAQACASGERIPTWGTFNFLFGKIANPTQLGGFYIYERENRFYCYGKTQTRDYNATDKVVSCLCQ